MKLWSTPTTQQGWLDSLGKRLVWYFPSLQAREILADYQEQFEAGQERGRTESEMVQSLGSPGEAAARLLEEEPTARSARLRYSVTWGILMALCLAFLWVSMVNATYANQLTWIGAYVFIPVGAAVLFMLLRGPVRVELEEKYPPEKSASPVLVYGVPFVLTVLFETTEQIMVLLTENGRLTKLGDISVGEFNTWLILFLDLGLLVLLVWLLARSVTATIRYFPGVIHTVGAMGTTFFSYAYCTSIEMAPLPAPALAMLLCLAPYGISLLTAVIFPRGVDRRTPMPRMFHPVENSMADWLHRLGHSLLGWFPAEQAMEIVEDYREQFELGLERGKTEEDLIAEMNRPEVVVRALVKEDWKARYYHRKHLWWAAPLAVGAWLLLELAWTFEFGWGGLRWLFYGGDGYKATTFALVLSAVSLFALLHGRGRAALEKQFPTAKKPSIFLWLLPLVLNACMTGYVLYILQNPSMLWRDQIIGWPLLVVCIELSVLGMIALLVWSLSRCGSGSIWYFPAAVHIVGYVAQVLCYGIFLRAMDPESGMIEFIIRRFFYNLTGYGMSVVLAIAFGLIIRSAGKKR